MIVGLTGGYCAGKNAVADLLTARGWVNIEVDAMGHRALGLCLDEVCALLGPAARGADGLPDRRAIGSLVFADASLMLRYEAIVHPVMNRLTDEAIDRAIRSGGRKALVNAALLYRLPQATRCSLILETRAPALARVLRGMRRDGLSPAAALARIRSQRPLWALRKRVIGRVRYLRNDGSLAALEKRLAAAFAAEGIPW